MEEPIRTPALRWPDSKSGPWSVSFAWAEVGGRYDVVGIELWKGIERSRETSEAVRPVGVASAEAVVEAARKASKRAVELGEDPEEAAAWVRMNASRDSEGDEPPAPSDRYRRLPHRGPEPITAGSLRKIPWASLMGESRQSLIRAHGAAALVSTRLGVLWLADQLMVRADLKIATTSGGGRRARLGRDHFEAVADVYAEAWKNNEHPRIAVAEHFLTSRSTAARWIQRARDLKLLNDTRPGVAGGVPPSKKTRRKG